MGGNMQFEKNEEGSLVIVPITKDEEKFLDALLATLLAWENLKPKVFVEPDKMTPVKKETEASRRDPNLIRVTVGKTAPHEIFNAMIATAQPCEVSE